MEADYRKFTVLSFFIFCALSGYIAFRGATQIVDWLKIGGGNVFMGYSWTVVGGAIASTFALLLFIVLLSNSKATTFTDEVFAELAKTTFPTGKETLASTMVVSIMVGLAAVVLFFMDYLWGVVFRVLL